MAKNKKNQRNSQEMRRPQVGFPMYNGIIPCAPPSGIIQLPPVIMPVVMATTNQQNNVVNNYANNLQNDGYDDDDY